MASNFEKLELGSNKVVWIGPVPELNPKSIIRRMTAESQFYANSKIEENFRKILVKSISPMFRLGRSTVQMQYVR